MQQSVGVGMAGVSEEIVDWGLFDEAAGVHHVYATTDIGDDAEVVRDEDDGGAFGLLQLFEEFQDLRLNGDVEGSGGFVGDEKRWFAG